MIDTIVLRIHNISQYPGIVDKLMDLNEGQSTFDISNAHEKRKFVQLKQVEYGDTGKLFTFYRNKVLTSSHYYLGYYVNLGKDYIELNFSIPKYLYGTNIMQFVPHSWEEGFREEFDWDMKSIKQTFDRLMFFITDFLEEWSIGLEIADNDIEINRIDICYNQVFDTKDHALKYLDLQKRIRKRFVRKKSNESKSFETSIFLKTEKYSAKIYHKGSEYESKNGELSHHRKINGKEDRTIFQVDNEYDEEGTLLKEGLRSIADRMLRYEITFRNSHLSYIFRRKMFAVGCPILSGLKADYKRVKSILDKCNREASKDKKAYLDYLDPRVKKKAISKYLDEYKKLPQPKKTNHEIYESIINQRVSFRLEIDQETIEDNKTLSNLKLDKSGRPIVPKRTVFDDRVFNYLVREFMDFMEQFKINSKEKFNNYQQKILDYNSKIEQWNYFNPDKKKQRISESRVNKVLLLLQHHTIDELVDLKVISRRTKYNFLKDLERLEINNNGFGYKFVQNIRNDFVNYFEMTKLHHIPFN
jgi:hypothetical protein